jgi:hypothetical protein
VTGEELAKRYPKLFHMAEGGSWAQISKLGLLSTSALLDLYGITGRRRFALENEHRPISVTLENARLGSCVLRDQRPMPPARLSRCLPRGVTPSTWYRSLNGKVFFWTSHERLLGLLNAQNYRGKRHDVLIVDTQSLVAAHEKDIELCHINSGNTFPYLHPKRFDVFKRLADYPLNRNGNPRPPVVEVLVKYGVPQIRRFVLDVRSRTSTKDYGSLL